MVASPTWGRYMTDAEKKAEKKKKKRNVDVEEIGEGSTPKTNIYIQSISSTHHLTNWTKSSDVFLNRVVLSHVNRLKEGNYMNPMLQSHFDGLKLQGVSASSGNVHSSDASKLNQYVDDYLKGIFDKFVSIVFLWTSSLGVRRKRFSYWVSLIINTLAIPQQRKHCKVYRLL